MFLFKPKKKSIKKKSSSIKKTRKKNVEDIYAQYLKKYYNYTIKDKNINIDKRKLYWGLGVEHELQLFHISKKAVDGDSKHSKIIFDSQESTCFLVNDKNKRGSCCKGMKECYYDNKQVKKILKETKNKNLINKDDKDWLKKIPWEFSGRASSGCLSDKQILKRVPILMPEFITSEHKNRSIESITNELLFLENKFIKLQMKNPYTKQKVKKYGEIRQSSVGALDNIKVPIKPTILDSEYNFEDKRYLDYLGSYHITITLPYTKDMNNDIFIENHMNFANQFQWIEPLLLTAFFSSDPRIFTEKDYHEKVRGSFRIMATGWGNIAGSDIRKLNKGIGRYGNRESKWRKGLKYEISKKLMDCDSKIRIISEPGAIGILSSNIRTFDYDFSSNCEGRECPKVSGAPLRYPNGIELRIFDHFSTLHILELLRIIVLLAENSRIHTAKKYVYSNLSWRNTMREIIKYGWRATMSDKYITELNNQLGLKIKKIYYNGFELFEEVVKQLFSKNKDGFITNLMSENKYKSPPVLPQINRFSWQISFNHKYSKYVKKFMKLNLKINNIYSFNHFTQIFYKVFTKKVWENYMIDVLYALQAPPNKNVKLIIKNGIIKEIKYLKY